MNKMYLGLLAAAVAFSACSSNDNDDTKPAEERWRISEIKDYGQPSAGQTTADTSWTTFIYNTDGTVKETKEKYKNTLGVVYNDGTRFVYANGKLAKVEVLTEGGTWATFKDLVFRDNRLALVIEHHDVGYSTDSVVYGTNGKPSAVWHYSENNPTKHLNKFTWNGESVVSNYEAAINNDTDTLYSETAVYTYDNKPGYMASCLVSCIDDESYAGMEPCSERPA